MRIVAHNLFYKLSDAQWRSDIAKVKDRADVIAFNEAKRIDFSDFFGDDWEVHHQHRKEGEDEGREGEAIVVRKDAVDLSDFTNDRITRMPPGVFPDRFVASAILDVKGRKHRLAVLHAPANNGNWREKYYVPFVNALNAWIKDHNDYPLIIAGDWNYPLRRQRPPGIPDRFHFRGVGVIGFGIEDRVKVEGFGSIADSQTFSDHGAAQLIVRGGVKSAPATDEQTGHPDEPVLAAPITIATQNLYIRDNQAEYKEDIDRIKDRADLIMLQEANDVPIEKYFGDKTFDVWHPDLREHNAFAWRVADLEVLDRGRVHLAKQEGGHQDERVYRLLWLKAKFNGLKFLFGNVHLPTWASESADPGIFSKCVDALEEWWKQQDLPIVIGGDWNRKLDHDPGGLARKLDAKWRATNVRNIDGFLHTRGIGFSNVIAIDDGVHSDHPIVLGQLQPKIFVDSDEPEAGTTTKPVGNIQKNQTDTGHDTEIGHDDCCGGTEIP